MIKKILLIMFIFVSVTNCSTVLEINERVNEAARITYGNVIDCGSITIQSGCPSIQEGFVAVTPEYEFDCGRL